MQSNNLIYQFRITLLEIDPPIWRSIQVPSSYSFWDLHVAIQDAMGWLDYHLHDFQIKRPRGRKILEIGIPDEDTGTKVLAGWEQSVSDYFVSPGEKAIYNYDYGDSWHHEIIFEGILLKDKSSQYPRCIAGARACPPEDCGGVPGYHRLLKTLSHPKDPEFEETIKWLKGHAKNYYPFQPEHFIPDNIKFWNPLKRFKIAFSNEPI